MNTAFQLEVADAPGGLKLARVLAGRGLPTRAYALALDLHQQALRNADEVLLAESSDCLADCCVMTAHYEPGIRFARSGRALWQARGDIARQAGASSRLALLLSAIGEQDALTAADAALDLAEQAGEPIEVIRALDATSVVLTLLKQPDRAIAFSERAVALSRAEDFPLPSVLINLAEALVQVGLQSESETTLAANIARALAVTREALAQARTRGDGWVERLAVNNIAEYSLHVGDTATAEAVLPEYDQAAGEPTDRCRIHHMWIRGRTQAAQGRPEHALAPLLACRRMATALGELETLTPCHLDIANAHAALGNFEAALASHRAFHDSYVRQASEAAQRRARIYALQRETEALRAAASEAESRASNLAMINDMLSREAERLTRTSLEDPLTGLPNRRRLDVAFLDLLTSKAAFVLAMIDVDHFKQVNDRFSHPVGDAVLRVVADLLAGGARHEDLVVRYGGEEFALLMRDADPQTAAAACERLRASVQGYDWSTLRPGLSVTISIGVAASTEEAGHDAVVALADFRLYRAKQSGRNRVIAAS
jgi:diguanylate cyclase (GGDEF)-like protein